MLAIFHITEIAIMNWYGLIAEDIKAIKVWDKEKELYTCCPWCYGSLDDYELVQFVQPFTEDNPKYRTRYVCKNCMFSFSEENYIMFCTPDEDELEDSISEYENEKKAGLST